MGVLQNVLKDTTLEAIHLAVAIYIGTIMLLNDIYICTSLKQWSISAIQGLGTSLRAFSGCEKEKICALVEEYLQ